jgi:beta-xylosidase
MTSKAAMFTTAVVTLACAFGLFADSTRAWQFGSGGGTFKNPALCADYPGPDIIRVTNDFHMVSTMFVDTPGIRVLHSRVPVNCERVRRPAK